MQNDYKLSGPIKILLDVKTYQTLKDDSLFLGFESEHQLSKKIIFDSFKNFQKELIHKKETLFHALRNELYDDTKTKIAVNQSLKILFNSVDTDRGKNSKSSITLRMNKGDQADYLNIIDFHRSSGLDETITLTQYLRTFLIQYARLSRIERELIIYKNQYQSILKAIKKKFQINLQTKAQKIITIKPYQFIYFGDECHFLIGDTIETNQTFSIRLSRILDISHHDDIQFDKISEDTIALVKTYENGQFQYSALSSGLDIDNVLHTLIQYQKRASL
jgi:hypothetical protein